MRQLRLGLPDGAKAVEGTVKLDDRDLVARVAFYEGFAAVNLNWPVTAEAGDTVRVALKWT